MPQPPSPAPARAYLPISSSRAAGTPHGMCERLRRRPLLRPTRRVAFTFSGPRPSFCPQRPCDASAAASPPALHRPSGMTTPSVNRRAEKLPDYRPKDILPHRANNAAFVWARRCLRASGKHRYINTHCPAKPPPSHPKTAPTAHALRRGRPRA